MTRKDIRRPRFSFFRFKCQTAHSITTRALAQNPEQTSHPTITSGYTNPKSSRGSKSGVPQTMSASPFVALYRSTNSNLSTRLVKLILGPSKLSTWATRTPRERRTGGPADLAMHGRAWAIKGARDDHVATGAELGEQKRQCFRYFLRVGQGERAHFNDRIVRAVMHDNTVGIAPIAAIQRRHRVGRHAASPFLLRLVAPANVAIERCIRGTVKSIFVTLDVLSPATLPPDR
jgi:hypothetical protein